MAPLEAKTSGMESPIKGEKPIVDAHDQRLWHEKPKTGFNWVDTKEPHSERRKRILKAHPEIATLYGADNWAAVFATCEVLFQIGMAYAVKDASWPVVVLCTLCISGFLNHSLQLAMHELSHDLMFETKKYNQWFAFFANLPTGVASSATFKRYHLEHHNAQGVQGVDTDLTSEIEARWFVSPFWKCMWMMFTPVFYSFRPMLVRPKNMNSTEALNWLIQASFDLAILHFFGIKSLFYLLWGSFWGLGCNPMTGHFISEHFEFIPDQETYSYYGPLNYLAYNVGYHNEHHDFPRVAGRRLPQIRKMAPEFYDTLPHYSSWSRVVYDFVFSDLNLYARVKRKHV